MDVLWGIIILLAMYVVIPVAIIGATLALLGGVDRVIPGRGRRRTADRDGARRG
jgi:hypothetical protein